MEIWGIPGVKTMGLTRFSGLMCDTLSEILVHALHGNYQLISMINGKPGKTIFQY